ncbi:MAG: GrpB family protein [Chloroflexota bacterium]|jgi:GrpB-like predicted nucleotidyltransferase (UPF0157 family)
MEITGWEQMIGQYKRDLSVVPYRDAWPMLFEQEANLLRSALGEKALRIEHIGNTSIPGLAAKPIIDIMVAVASYAQSMGLIPVVEALGYQFKPHDTIPERLFFSKEREPEIRTHHLNLTERSSGFWKDQLAFRDYLRTHERLAAEYVELKEQLAAEYARTGELPREGKTAFVTYVLALARKTPGEDAREQES